MQAQPALLGPASIEGARPASSSPPRTTSSMRSTPPPARRFRDALVKPVPLSAPPCGNIDPMGVDGTPTIDPTAGIVYLEVHAGHAGPGGPRHKVFGLSLATGVVALGWPVDVRRNWTCRSEWYLQQRATGPAQRADPGQRHALRPASARGARRRLRHLQRHGAGFQSGQARSVRLLVDRNHRWRQLGTERAFSTARPCS